jgi:SpoVK/Ycf46/Vps4 family AAA+-type ATPase
MYGPPGTGKNTFAYAIAKEFKGAKFVDMDVSKMNSKWHGESEQNILGTMKAAIKYAHKHPNEKIFVFIDEIDSVMMQDKGNGAKLSQDILNAFKKGFNGLTKEKNIIVIGATNLRINPELAKAEGKLLDTAMLDRFGEKVLVDLPDKEQIKIAITNFYNNPEREMIDGALKDIKNPTLDKIAEFLAKPEHQTSFRKIEDGICKRAGRKTAIGKDVTMDDFIEAIKYHKANLNITDDEMNAFLKSLK